MHRAPADPIGDGDPAPGQPEHHDLVSSDAGAAHHFGQVTTGIHPIAEHGHHLLDQLQSPSSPPSPTRATGLHRCGLRPGRRPAARGEEPVWDEPGQLNSHHRDTLAQIFRHPLSHNIEWHSILSLLNSVATSGDPQRSRASPRGESESFDPQATDIDADAEPPRRARCACGLARRGRLAAMRTRE